MLTPHRIPDWLFRILSLGAGEAAAGAGGGNDASPPAGETSGGGSFFSDDEDGGYGKGRSQTQTDDDGDDDGAGAAPANAGRTRGESEGEESEDSDSSGENTDEGEDEGGESGSQDTGDEGGGAEDTGVDPAVALSIRRNWEGRFAGAAPKETDPLAALDLVNTDIPQATRERVKQLFAEEKDIEAIQEVVKVALRPILRSYDESRIAPALTETQIALRNSRVIRSVADFDEKYPKARTPEISQKMAAIYDEFKEKAGYKRADEIPVEDYFLMAGGSLRRPRANAAPKVQGKSAQEIEEERKNKALAAARQPDRIGAPKGGKPKAKSKGEAAEVGEVFSTIQRTRFDPFTIR